jgi:thioredoxin-related protein
VKVKTAILMVFFMIGLGIENPWAASDKIEWHSYESGMARSRFEKKNVFLYFYTETCAYCGEMERKTFKDPVVIATLNRNFIPIRVDADREKAVASDFRIQAVPDSWFFTENREIIGHRPGFFPPDLMVKILTAIVAGNGGQ